MREILFRGKRYDGIMQEGYYFARPIINKHYIILGEYQWEVDPDTVGQYTGLLDKKGKKIFEGDICKMEISKGYPSHSPFLISIQNACAGFEPMMPGLCHPDDRKWQSFWRNDGDYMWDTDYFTVIGNIHDDPDIFEKTYERVEEDA